MSITIKIIQRTDKLNRDNTAPIHLRLTHKGKIRYGYQFWRYSAPEIQ